MIEFETLKNISLILRRQSIDGSLETVEELLEIYDDLRQEHTDSVWHPYKPMIISLLESAGLLPYVAENMQDLTLTDILHLMPYEMEDDKFFHHGQIQALDSLLDDKVSSLAIIAPTSFGKTKLIDYYIKKKQPDSIIIIQPTIALLQETFIRLRASSLGSIYSIFMDQEDIDNTSVKWIAVWTQERCHDWLKQNPQQKKAIDLFVIDEFYLIDPKRNIPDDSDKEPDDERAEILRHVYRQIKHISKKTLLLGPVADTISDKKIKIHKSDYSPVRQTISPEYEKWQNTPNNDALKLQRLVEIINSSQKGLLVFRPSPGKAHILAEALLKNELKEGFFLPKQVKILCLWLEENYPDSVKDWTIYKALEHGIGIHHSKMPRSLQKMILWLFNEGCLHTLIMTPTIVQGVNTVAESLVYWKNLNEGRKAVDYFAYKNIIGRAGRLGFHITGKIYLFDAPPEKQDIIIDVPLELDSETIMELDETITTELVETDNLLNAKSDHPNMELISAFKNEFPGLKFNKVENAIDLADKYSSFFTKNPIKSLFKKDNKDIAIEILNFCGLRKNTIPFTYKSVISAFRGSTSKSAMARFKIPNTDRAYELFFQQLSSMHHDFPKGISILLSAAKHKKLIGNDKAEKLYNEALFYSRFQTNAVVYTLEEQGIPFHIAQKLLETKSIPLKTLFKVTDKPSPQEVKKALMDSSVRQSILTETDVFILDNILRLPEII